MYRCGCLESTFIGGRQATCARPRNPEASLNDLVPSARCAPSAPDAKRKEKQTGLIVDVGRKRKSWQVAKSTGKIRGTTKTAPGKDVYPNREARTVGVP